MASVRRRLGTVAGWTGVVVAAAALVWWAVRPQSVAVDLGEVTRGDLRVTLDHEGRTRVRHRYVVSAPVGGRLIRIGLEPGDRVRAKDTVIATIMPESAPLLDARTRATAEARVRTATAAIEQARAAAARARAASEFAEAERVRQQRLFEEGAVSARDLAAAETDARMARQAVSEADAAVAAAGHELEVARAALTATTEAGRAGAQALIVRAPIDGVVFRRLHESEVVVRAGEPLVEIADLATLEVVADYLSADAVRIEPGMPALVDRWGGTAPLEAHVRLIEPSGFMKVSALGVEEQRVNVVLALDGPAASRASLGDGFRVEVRVVIAERKDVLRVPASALFRLGEAWAVFAVDESGRARTRRLEVGQRTALAAEVIEGLRGGDRVVLHPSDRVADGVRIDSRR